MKWLAVVALVAVVSLSATGCGGTSKNSAATQDLQKQADMFQIDQIERTWHKAASTIFLEAALKLMAGIYDGRIDLSSLRG